MPGSLTTPSRTCTRVNALARVAFRRNQDVSARNDDSFAVGIEMWRARHPRVRWRIHRFPDGPQSGSHNAHVSTSPPTITDCGISPVRF